MGLQAIICPLVCLITVTTRANGENSNPAFYGISTYSYTSSEVCARCHKDIYDLWENSMHAKSVDDPVFVADFIMVQLARGSDIKAYCLSCHAPTTSLTKDYDLRNGISSEGVTCDFCHSVSALGTSPEQAYYTLDPGQMKYGPFRDASSPAHETAYSENHTKSEFCAGCHELVNKHGVAVMATYSEWKNSAYAKEGIQCQNCHMPITYNLNVVDKVVKESDHFLTAHEFRGGHSLINLQHSSTIETEVTRNGNVAKVITRVTNSESGHKLPTGTPGRKVILNTKILDKGGNLLAEVNKVYRKVLVDDNGVIIEDNAGMILDAAQIFSDNRIAPKETRIETFEFDVPDAIDYFTVQNTLQYEFSRPVLKTEKVVFQMAQDVIDVKGDHAYAKALMLSGENSRTWGVIISLGVIVLSLLAFSFFERKKWGAREEINKATP
ncbi:MAG: hypothetical protein A2W25_06240 [candidate division Zixibacteria bacterium RBG_16_53_22]|nr:MAG: hypothetical protein A2W25_06240 [candidate division Zixibacteria bacterium RBG_16_53_22]